MRQYRTIALSIIIKRINLYIIDNGKNVTNNVALKSFSSILLSTEFRDRGKFIIYHNYTYLCIYVLYI